MDELLATGAILNNRFRITEALGHRKGTAAYLAADLDKGGAWPLVWESMTMFQMQRKPEGVLGYHAQNERHYLFLQLEGQDLGLIHSAAGVLDESWAALWISQACNGVGQWHSRTEERIVCLDVGDIRLADIRLTSTGRAILPNLGRLSEPVDASVPGQALIFSAPEKARQEQLTARSDVYALGAALYCLITGAPPPDPRALAKGQAELIAPHKIQHKVSGRLEKAVLKAMSLDPSKRHPTAMQLSLELDRCVPRRLRRLQIS